MEAFSEALEPRLRLTGEMAVLDQFKAFFADRSLEKGTEVPLSRLQPLRDCKYFKKEPVCA